MGAEFQVSSVSATNRYPDVAMAGHGSFVVAWVQQFTEVQARRYGADGAPAGPEFTVTDFGADPSVAAGTAGDFVIVWVAGETYGRRFDAAGNGVGAEFQVPVGPSPHFQPDVSMRPDGGFMVAGGGSGDVFVSCHDPSGNPVGVPVHMDADPTSFDYFPRVSVRPDGSAIVGWTTDTANPTHRVGKVRMLDAGCVPFGVTHLLSSTLGDYGHTDVASDAEGASLAGWAHYANNTLRARRFSATGRLRGEEFPLTGAPSLVLPLPRLAGRAKGSFAAVWSVPMTLGPPDVFARILTSTRPAPSAVR